MSVVGESHCVGHQLWHVHDVDHPRHDPAARRLLGDPVVEVYARLDAVVGEHLAAAGADADRATCTCRTACGPHYDGDHLLDEVLRPHRRGRPDDPAHAGGAPGSPHAALGRMPDVARSTALARSRPRPAAPDRDARPPVPAIPPGRPSPTGAGTRSRTTRSSAPSGSTWSVASHQASSREAARSTGSRRSITRGAARAHQRRHRPAGRPARRPRRRGPRAVGRRHLPGPVRGVGPQRPDRAGVVAPTIGTVYAPYEHWRTGDHHDRGLLLAARPGDRAGRRADSMGLTEDRPHPRRRRSAIELDEVDGRAAARPRRARAPGDARAARRRGPGASRPSTAAGRRRGGAPHASPSVDSTSNRRRPPMAEGALDLARAAIGAGPRPAQADLDREAAALRQRVHHARPGEPASGRRCAGSTPSRWRRTASSR